jgi:16S rRNA (cytosine967-C5)-methyltransferase
MTPAARVQAAIELLDAIIASAREGGAAADALIARYFKTRRYAGSKDRRAVRELVYRAVRRAGDPPASGRAAMLGVVKDEPELGALFDGSPHGPAPTGPDEQAASAGIAPAWLLERLDPLVTPEERARLLDRAPLDVRVNLLKGSRADALTALPEAVPTPHAPQGLRLPDGLRVEDTAAWREGLIEVQDEGSQLACVACDAKPGERVIDLCAGAGGKTLALAAAMTNQGAIIAADSDRARLSRIAQRAARAGVSIVSERLLDPGRELEALAGVEADLVLVDAPCSGSGTWRRNPETRWRMTPERLERLVALQAQLLDIAAGLVAPGGRLVYVVCSLLSEEGRGQSAALTARSSLVPDEIVIPAGRAAGTGRLLTPGHDGTDGFFVARWRRPC